MSETFYGGFYGFDSAPFHITPDPTLLFPTDTHRAALGAIEYGISAGKGFIVVSGEVGVGKTTVLRVCLDALDSKKTKIIYLFSPALTTAELYATILDEFDVTLPPTANAADVLRMLQRNLLAVHASGMQVILAVDEAQNMPEATLESLRILSNLETHKSKLLQIILVGQPELETVLARHSLRQLAQRVAVRARIKPLTFRQSCRYIHHRTRCAGRMMRRSLFTTPALFYLAFISRGIPRTINICCDNALINGYGHAAERISLRIVRESCKAMKYGSALRRPLAAAGMALVLVGIFLIGNALLRRHPVAPAAPSAPAAAASDSAPAHDPAAMAANRAAARAPAPGETTSAENAGSSESTPDSSAADPAQNDSPHLAELKDSLAELRAREAAAGDTSAAEGSPSAGTSQPATTPPPADAAATSGIASAKPAEAAAQAPSSLRPSPDTGTPASPLPWVSSDNAPPPNSSQRAAPPPNSTQHAASPPSSAQRTKSAKSAKKWVVRYGDTLYKACRATYLSCDEQTIRAILARNPKIGRGGTIYEGDVILMPEQVGSMRSN